MLQMHHLKQYLEFPELFLIETLNVPLGVLMWQSLVPIVGADVVLIAFAISVNAEWCINSLCHASPIEAAFGKASGECHARDIWLVGILNAGEGFHGAHHDTPWCAKHGRRHWYNFDLTYLVILILEATGLIRNVQHANQPDTRTRKPKQDELGDDTQSLLDGFVY